MITSQGFDCLYILTDSKGNPVKHGAALTDQRGEKAVLLSGEAPHHCNSTGRVYLKAGKTAIERYPSVYGLEWVPTTSFRPSSAN